MTMDLRSREHLTLSTVFTFNPLLMRPRLLERTPIAPSSTSACPHLPVYTIHQSSFDLTNRATTFTPTSMPLYIHRYTTTTAVLLYTMFTSSRGYGGRETCPFHACAALGLRCSEGAFRGMRKERTGDLYPVAGEFLPCIIHSRAELVARCWRR